MATTSGPGKVSAQGTPIRRSPARTGRVRAPRRLGDKRGRLTVSERKRVAGRWPSSVCAPRSNGTRIARNGAHVTDSQARPAFLGDAPLAFQRIREYAIF